MTLGAGLAACTPGLADVLTTRGGEKLIGTVVEERSDEIVFDSEAFGRLVIERSLILSVERGAAPPPALEEVTAPEQAAAPAQAPAPAAEAAPAPAEPAEPTSGTLAFLARINPLKAWKSSLNVGFVARRGDDSDNDLVVRFRSDRTTAAGNEHRIQARYYYAEDVFEDNRQVGTDDQLTADYRYTHGLTERFFLQADSRYYRDAIKQMDHEVTQTVGIGLRARRERWSLSFTPAAGVQWRELAGEEDTNAVVGLYQAFDIELTQTMKLRQDFDYLVAVDDSDDWSSRFGLELTQKIGAVWSLALRYDFIYDSIVGKDASEDQQRLAFTLGVDF
jgi:putative salt-induced outer membrane protein YdiY